MTQSVGVFQTEAECGGALICKLELTAVQLSHTSRRYSGTLSGRGE